MSEKRIIIEKHHFHHRVIHRPDPPSPPPSEGTSVLGGLFGLATLAGLLVGAAICGAMDSEK